MSFFADLASSLERNRITRRQALWLLGAGAAAGLSGCATSPVTGESILVGMSEAQEKQTDAQVAPHQFSQDLGAIQDESVNRYVSDLGQRMGLLTHRPQMPYSYRVLNANYVNAYTFPGGAMGVTRGILADLDDDTAIFMAHVGGAIHRLKAAIGPKIGAADAGSRKLDDGIRRLEDRGFSDLFAADVISLGTIYGDDAVVARDSQRGQAKGDAQADKCKGCVAD